MLTHLVVHLRSYFCGGVSLGQLCRILHPTSATPTILFTSQPSPRPPQKSHCMAQHLNTVCNTCPKIPTLPTAPAKFLSGAVSVAAPAYATPSLDKKRVALIIETRPASVLPELLAHMISVLPPQWVVKMVGTNESLASTLSSRSLGYHLKSTKLQLVNLPDHYPMTRQETVSQTLTNITFYRHFMASAERISMFQTDSIICAASKQSVDDWVDKNYSWVGAPGFKDVYCGKRRPPSSQH